MGKQTHFYRKTLFLLIAFSSLWLESGAWALPTCRDLLSIAKPAAPFQIDKAKVKLSGAIPVGARSMARKYPSLPYEIQVLSEAFPRFVNEAFIDSLVQQTAQGCQCKPTLQNIAQSILERRILVAKILRQLAAKYNEPQLRVNFNRLAARVEVSEREMVFFNKRTQQNINAFKRAFSPKDRQHWAFLEGELEAVDRHWTGEFGELIALSRIDGVGAVNVKFADFDGAFIDRVFKNVNPGNLDEYRRRYPSIFKDHHIFRSTANTPNELIGSARQWLEAKEIDIIRRTEFGNWAFVEVKNYPTEMTLEHLSRVGGDRRKSIIQQQQELVEIRNFLGMSKYDLEIIFINGIDSQAAAALEKMGFKVLGKNQGVSQ